MVLQAHLPVAQTRRIRPEGHLVDSLTTGSTCAREGCGPNHNLSRWSLDTLQRSIARNSPPMRQAGLQQTSCREATLRPGKVILDRHGL